MSVCIYFLVCLLELLPLLFTHLSVQIFIMLLCVSRVNFCKCNEKKCKEVWKRRNQKPKTGELVRFSPGKQIPVPNVPFHATSVHITVNLIGKFLPKFLLLLLLLIIISANKTKRPDVICNRREHLATDCI